MYLRVDLGNPNMLSNNPSYAITAPSSITTFRGRGDNATNDGGVVRYITLVPTPALESQPEQTIGNGGSATLNAKAAALAAILGLPTLR